ncbi:SRPBCC family protein [Lysobacter sp. TAF61]|uniref:SRPBCC family protein n=1 Tax=Lysobacter sp. TAF61 TaxID=3233072 RepID=UPI003F9E214B
MFKFIAIAVVVLIAAVLLFAATRPDTFRVERRAHIQAPPEQVFAQINDFRRWQAWSPYEKLDPQMQREIGGAAQGTGATYRWDGNSKAGAGRMEIVQSVPSSRIEIQLDFSRPMQARSTAQFTIVPQGNGSDVTWSMNGDQPYMSKLFSVFVNMDRMIGKDFEAGLDNLRQLSERGS